MKIIFILLIFIFPNIVSAKNLNFTKIVNLKSPWGSTFIADNSILVTEKSGAIKLINIKNKNIDIINHNINFLEHGQGGVLDILYKDDFVYVS